jgi:NAD(P)-dependent dehydrogenase (short-subunit alcohol dehydrogenase family)
MADPSARRAPPRVALVTGANRGIGRAIASALARDGLTVLFTARRGGEAAAAAAPLARQGLLVASRSLDVTDPRSVAAVAAWVTAEYGRLDVLVNNAGAYYDADQAAVSADLAIVQAALDVNLLGPWRTCEAFLPLMLQHGYGRIVNVSSGGGAFAGAGAGTPAYSVSKAALNMLTVKLAAELAGSGVLVNAACPGWVRTAMGSPAAPRSPEEGADTPCWLATLPADGPSGGFFRDRQRIPW